MKQLLFVFSFFLSAWASSQDFLDAEYYLLDSLTFDVLDQYDSAIVEENIQKYHAAEQDSAKVSAIANIVDQLWEISVWPRYNDWILETVQEKLKNDLTKEERLFYKAQLGAAFNNKGFYLNDIAEYEQALRYYKKALEVDWQISNYAGMGADYSNIGRTHVALGNVQLAIDSYQNSAEIRNMLNDSSGLATIYNNIGVVYDDQKEVKKAKSYYLKSLEINEKIKDYNGMAVCYNNIATVIQDDNAKEALEYYLQGLKYYNLTNDPRGMGQLYNNIGQCCIKLNQYDSAQLYLDSSLTIYTKFNRKSGKAKVYRNMGLLELKRGNYLGAKKFGLDAHKIFKEIGSKNGEATAVNLLHRTAVKLQDWKMSYEMLTLEIALEDSLHGFEAKKAIANHQAEVEYAKKVAEDEKQQALKDAEFEKRLAVEKEKEKKQKIIAFSAIGGLLIVVCFLIFVFNRLKLTRAQKAEIDVQKSQLESTHEQLAEHHKEISDSILYAKRIQETIMPKMDVMLEALEDAFVMYIPKDVVAGDFYWMEQLNDKVYFAAADCTGHGVPGAMVSVVCSNALNKSLLEESILEPGKILDRSREIVIERFSEKGGEINDGMDISLCMLDRQTNTLKWAGANNPLWVIREHAKPELKVPENSKVENFENYKLIEIKPDKQPIGKSDISKQFTTHTFQLEKNDRIYIFTDGLQDQFGGPKGKKFKAKKLKQILIENQSLGLNEQQEIIQSEFESWKKSLEQVDDICMIGLTI